MLIGGITDFKYVKEIYRHQQEVVPPKHREDDREKHAKKEPSLFGKCQGLHYV